MVVRPVVFIVSLCLVVLTPAKAEPIPTTAQGFTRYVAKQMRKRIRRPRIRVKGPLTLTIGPVQANLDRIYGFCRQNRDGCNREVTTYIDGAVQIIKRVNEKKLVKVTPADVRIVVRTREYIRYAGKIARPASGKFAERHLAGNLSVVPAVDMPSTLRLLTDADRKALKLSTEQVFELGIANVRRELKPLMRVAKVVRRGQIGQISGGIYASSRLGMHRSWAPLARAHGGVLIVAAPAKDLILYIGEDTPMAVNAFRVLTKRVLAQSPAPLSAELLQWSPNGWRAVR
jgi:hypothetical protein